MLELEGFSAFRDDFQVVFDVSLRLAEGETLALVGANGAGKTSLLSAIAGLTAGRGGLRLGEVDLAPLAAPARARAGVALAPEGRRMFASLTARENLLMGARIGRPGPWGMGSVLRLFPALEACADRPAGLLSGGQQQMVAIGRALMANPALLMLDELSLGLAPVVVDEVHAALAAMRAASAMMTILVEQDLRRALAAADRFLCLLEGQAVLGGAAEVVDFDALGRAYFGEAG